MCGSSSTTTTVPPSALTFLASHLPHPELPECGFPYTTMTIGEHQVHSGGTPLQAGHPTLREARTRGAHMSPARTHLIRLGAVALASGATLGTVAGAAGA